MFNFISDFDFSLKNILFLLVIIFFSPSIINIFRLIFANISYQKLINNIKEEKFSKVIEEFPVHDACLNTYRKSKSKIDYFLEMLSKNQSTELVLNQEELNDLYAQGKTINKYIPGKYVYYQIEENKIVENLIEGPSPLPPNPYFTRTKEIYFPGELKEFFKTVKENNKKINYQTPPYSLNKSSLIFFVLDIIKTPDQFPFKFRGSSEYKKGLVILNKIKSVEVRDNKLVISS